MKDFYKIYDGVNFKKIDKKYSNRTLKTPNEYDDTADIRSRRA